MPTVVPNPLIAVVGISGYIGSYAALSALQAGYRVRGTVRSLDRSRSIKDAYVKSGIQNIDSCLEFVVLDDLNSVEQYRRAFEDVDAIINPAVNIEKLAEMAFIDVAIESTLSMLRAAQLVPSVKRVVMTSSVVSTILQGHCRDKVITDEDWNDDSVKELDDEVVAGRTPNPLLIYTVGKVKSEKAAWDFMGKEKPHFDLVSVLPGMCMGPGLYGPPQSTAAWFSKMFKNFVEKRISSNAPLPWCIDVRDCGRIHVKTLSAQSVGGKRVICACQALGLNEALAMIRKNFPNVETVAPDVQGMVGEKWMQKFDNSCAQELVGEFTSAEQSLVDLGKSLGY